MSSLPNQLIFTPVTKIVHGLCCSMVTSICWAVTGSSHDDLPPPDQSLPGGADNARLLSTSALTSLRSSSANPTAQSTSTLPSSHSASSSSSAPDHLHQEGDLIPPLAIQGLPSGVKFTNIFNFIWQICSVCI